MNILFYHLAWVMFFNTMQKQSESPFNFNMVYVKNVTTHKNNMFHKGAHDSVLSLVTHTFLLFCLKIVIELVKMIWQCWIGYSREMFVKSWFSNWHKTFMTQNNCCIIQLCKAIFRIFYDLLLPSHSIFMSMFACIVQLQ